MNAKFDELLEDFESAIRNNDSYGVFLARDALRRHVGDMREKLDTAETIADLIENAP